MKATARLVNGSAASTYISRQAADIVRRKARLAGSEMVRLANADMASRFDLNRPGGRRRYPNSRRAATALLYRVDGTSFPITLSYRVVGGDDVVARITFMNFGTSPHTIPLSGAWQNPWAPGTKTARAGPPSRLAWFENGEWVFPASKSAVPHPGQGPTGFLERARDEAVARYLTS